MVHLAPVKCYRNGIDKYDRKNTLEKQENGTICHTASGVIGEILPVSGPVTPTGNAGTSTQLLLVTLFSKPLFALVCRHLVALALFAAGHAASFLRLRGK
jgi:hypothetical protein